MSVPGVKNLFDLIFLLALYYVGPGVGLTGHLGIWSGGQGWMLVMDTTGWMPHSFGVRLSFTAMWNTILVMGKGLIHLWSSFFMGQSVM